MPDNLEIKNPQTLPRLGISSRLTLTIMGTLIFYIFLNTSCRAKKEKMTAPDLPNILILLADDLGYGDLGCYGGVAQTPNLDAMAKNGLRFTQFYAAAPNCSPSRAGLLTGKSPSRIGIFNYLPEGHPMHLVDEEVTLAEVLKLKNYHTGHFGKWHLSCLPQNPALNQPQPKDQGFDYSFGTANNAIPSHLDPVNFVRNNQEVGALKGYACDLVVDEAIHWVTHVSVRDTQPFFAYVAFHEPHKKVASPPELVSNYSEHPKQDAEYFANVENMDQAVGRMISFLREASLLENTLILFASDNGSYRNGSNGKLLGGKSFVYEGGIRVPGIMQWSGMAENNHSVDHPAGLIDMMPTILELLDLEQSNARQLDGQSLMPLLKGQPFNRKRPLSWFFYRTTPEMALRAGDFVILGRDLDSTLHTHQLAHRDMEIIKNMVFEDYEIYNLRTDPSQVENISHRTHSEGSMLAIEINQRLQEIQQMGRFWDDLPEAVGTKKHKHAWRQLRPTGFSN